MIAGRILIAAGGARFFAPKRQLIPDRSNRRTVQINLNIVSTLVAKKAHTSRSKPVFAMATRCLFAADLDLATGKQVCPCVQTPGQSPRGLFAFHVVAVTRLFFSLYCVVYSENTTKRYKTLLLFLFLFSLSEVLFSSPHATTTKLENYTWL
uniref:(northern house mosquito) hypothetical protein n=1 Tax=Culex pipiens TaxID=7175 RepID=A0A8D8FS58_CULPI